MQLSRSALLLGLLVGCGAYEEQAEDLTGGEQELEVPIQGQLFPPPSPMAKDTPSPATLNSTKFVWAAAGDSYASGEGNPITERTGTNVGDFTGVSWTKTSEYFVSPNTVPYSPNLYKDDAYTCHRSDEAGVPKAHRKLKQLYPNVNFSLGFVACSGARTEHLIDTQYAGPDTVFGSNLGYFHVPQPPQLERIGKFKELNGDQLDALFMSIGGNDVGFAKIVADCITPFAGSCKDKWTPLLPSKLQALKNSYAALSSKIHTELGNVPVFISHYPNPSDDGGGGNPPVCQGAEFGNNKHDALLRNELTLDEAKWAFGLSGMLSDAATAAANQHGWTALSAHTAAYEGHGLCTSSPAVNLNSVALQRQGRDLDVDILPLDVDKKVDIDELQFSAGFMHPNDLGYRAYGDALVDALRPLVDAKLRGGIKQPLQLRVAAATKNGALTIRWKDMSTSESRYELEVTPARAEDTLQMVYPPQATRLSNGGFLVNLPANTNEFLHLVAGPGRFKYKLRACNGSASTSECSAYYFLDGTNTFPAAPANVRVDRLSVTVNGQTHLGQPHLNWDDKGDTIEYVVRKDPVNGSAATETRQSSNTLTLPEPVSQAKYRVAACNRVGCSAYVLAAQ